MKNVKNIIFDLGGVIINLDIPQTVNEFGKLGISNFENIFNQLAQTPLFDQFDKGLITEDNFFFNIKESFNLDHSIAKLEFAWNAMLLDFPRQRLEHLLEYKQKYNTFLLSNTNFAHIRAFEKILFDAHSENDLNRFFNKVYYSCQVNLRKPDIEIFELVLKENNLNAEETLFIDDTITHINAAKKLGINAVHLQKGQEFKLILDSILG